MLNKKRRVHCCEVTKNHYAVLHCFKDFTNSSNLRKNEQIQFDLSKSNLIAADKPMALDAVYHKVASKRKTDLTYALYSIKGT